MLMNAKQTMVDVPKCVQILKDHLNAPVVLDTIWH